ncbi:formate dehydrogenase accessory sulfurtransferase FdhD [Ruegeria sp. SCPC11]
MTSRVSLELVQKTTFLGCPILIAASSPTALAVDLADQAGITLVVNTKQSECAVFTHEYRVLRTV